MKWALSKKTVVPANSVSLYSGGPLDLLGTNRFIPPGGSFSARMTAVGDLSVQGDVYVSTSGSSDLTLTSTTGNVVVTGSINVSGPSSNLTIQAAQLASFNPSVVFAPSSGLFNMTGQTVFLDNAHFNSNTLVTLQSADRLPAFFPAANGGSLRRGAVNLGGNVTADGSTLLNGSNAGSYANFQVNR